MSPLRFLKICLALLAPLAAACSSSGRPSSPSDGGSKVLNAVVTEREYSAPGSAEGGSYRSAGTWYLSFEARDGDKMVSYRFPVTQKQYFRYPEGTRVELVLDDDRLRDIRPARE